jgi:single-stranded-DNA-specific exonuclease
MIVCQNNYTTEQLNIISALAKEFGISQRLANIIFSRGINTAEKMRKYIRPGKHNFLNPFLLKGMGEAVERIKIARENGERVLVFGDYDADGICATTVLASCLRDFGVREICTVIPERAQGYGLTHELVESMLEKYEPDLIITVDCGISCKDEVCFIQDVGVDVIVTDHHEIPDEIPDCTVINCKLSDQDYPFDALCGAGVAYKLGYALIGERANKYLDLVTIATIADSMPLLEENRDIVFEGLKLIKDLRNPAIAKLIEVSGLKDVTSTGLAFTVAPRINAAGRMGNANCALALLLEEDLKQMENYCNQLNDYNVQRQNECDKLLKSAKAKIELFNEEMLYSKDVSTTGVIFNLKNNYGWKDKQEIEAEVTSAVNIKIELSDD